MPSDAPSESTEWFCSRCDFYTDHVSTQHDGLASRGLLKANPRQPQAVPQADGLSATAAELSALADALPCASHSDGEHCPDCWHEALMLWAVVVGPIVADRLAARDRDHQAEVAALRATLAEVAGLVAWRVGRDTNGVDRMVPASDIRAALARTYGAARTVGEEADRG